MRFKVRAPLRLSLTGSIGASGDVAFATEPGPPPDALVQDWLERSTGPGVVAAYDFDDATYMANPAYVHPDSQQANVVRNATGGILGNGCLRINIPASDAESSGAWRAPLNQSWSVDGTTFGTTKFYIQFRVKLGAGRMQNDPGGDGGFKICNLGEYLFSSPQSSRSHPGNEIVIQQQGEGDPTANSGVPIAYRDLASMGGDSAAAWFRTDIPSGEIRHQTALDRLSGTDLNRYCLYDPDNPPDLMSAGCYRWQEEVWYTINLGVRINTPNGTSGNVFQFSIAGPNDTAFTVLYDESNTAMGFDVDIPGGPNGLWLIPFKTTRTPNGTVDSYHEYDQPVVSLLPIPCPKALPDWVLAMDPGDWIQIGNALSTIDPSPSLPGNTGPQAKVSAWNGLSVDPVTGHILEVAAGGHADWAGNQVDGIDLAVESPLWDELLASTPSGQILDASAYYSDGRPTSRHHFYGLATSAVLRKVIMFGGAWWSANGGTFQAVSSYDIAAGTYDPSGTHGDMPGFFGSDIFACCAGPRGQEIFLFQDFAVARWSATTRNTTMILAPGDDENAPVGTNGPTACDEARNRILLVGGQYDASHFYNIASNTFTEVTLTGAAASAVGNCPAGSMLWHIPSLDIYLLRDNSAGGTVYEITASGTTLTCTVRSTSGGSSIPTVANNDGSAPNGPYAKFIYIPQLNGCYLLPRHNAPGWFLRVH